MTINRILVADGAFLGRPAIPPVARRCRRRRMARWIGAVAIFLILGWLLW